MVVASATVVSTVVVAADLGPLHPLHGSVERRPCRMFRDRQIGSELKSMVPRTSCTPAVFHQPSVSMLFLNDQPPNIYVERDMLPIDRAQCLQGCGANSRNRPEVGRLRGLGLLRGKHGIPAHVRLSLKSIACPALSTAR
jgi:hypothetical protein